MNKLVLSLPEMHAWPYCKPVIFSHLDNAFYMNFHNIYLLLQMNGPTAVGSQESSSPAVRFLTILSQIYKGCSESSISCQYIRATGNVSFECLQFCLLAKHVNLTPRRPCSSFKYFNSPVPFSRVYQHFPSPPLWLTDSHCYENCCSRKKQTETA